MSRTVVVTVPATTANIGPGFDCLGAALSLLNRFQLQLAPKTKITARGLDAVRVVTDERNLAYQAIGYFFDYIDQELPNLSLEIDLEVPLARGLGSSATAIVGGLVGANALMDNPLPKAKLLELAIELEGHPDNVAPALLGGCRLAAAGAQENSWQVLELSWHSAVVPVIAIPEFELSTKAAREVLPQALSYGDAIFNAAHLGVLLEGLRTGNPEYLQAGMQDRLHQPYRTALIPGYGSVQAAATSAGAYGLVISGAGPTLLALTHTDTANQVAAAMHQAWEEQGITSQARVTELNRQGTVVEVVSD